MAIDDFRTQAEAMRGLLGDIGVTEEDYENAKAAKRVSLLSPPEHFTSAIRDEKGTFGMLKDIFFGEMHAPLANMFAPDYVQRKAQYKEDLKSHLERQKRYQQQQIAEPYYDALSNDTTDDDLEALRQLSVLQPDVYGGVLKKFETNRLAPDAATYTEGDFQHINGEWQLVQQASDGTVKYTPMGKGFKPENRLPSGEYIEKRGSFFNEEARNAEWRAQDIANLGTQMDEIGEEAWNAGIAGQVSEAWKQATGTENVQSMVKRKYDGIRVSKAISNLPPGVASDKDIELALAPFPTKFTNYEQLRGYVRALERAEEKLAAYSRHASDYVFSNGTESGMLEAWEPKWEAIQKQYKAKDGDSGLISVPDSERSAFEEWKKQKGL